MKKDNNGLVYIIGAGPGDPELITIKGINCLKKCDVIFFDESVENSLAGNTLATAKLIKINETITDNPSLLEKLNSQIIKYSKEGNTVGSDSSKLFGGRIGFNIKGQKEKQIVWMMENNKWTEKSLTFTNKVSGTATLFVHLGYGNISQTGEFKSITFKELQKTEIKLPELIRL